MIARQATLAAFLFVFATCSITAFAEDADGKSDKKLDKKPTPRTTETPDKPIDLQAFGKQLKAA
ncbi:MAG: hypothetical protein N2C14_23530, partial [Planctomycetales bacterium]